MRYASENVSLYEDMLTQVSHRTGRRFTITSSDNNIVVKGLVPGYSSKDIELKIEDDILSFIAEENLEKSLRGFNQRYTLSDTIEVEDITAICENGLLTVTLPKCVPEVYTKIIKVK